MNGKTKPITVFTPSYNRAYILGKCYESLKNQTCKEFEWLIIDDGSTDSTKELVEGWMREENGFKIRYAYKENGGLHTGYNKAIELMDTELSVCIDSDDSLPCDGIERILKIWNDRKDPDIAGLIGLDYDENGTLIGTLLPEEDSINAATLLMVPGVGDKKYVMRNDLWRQMGPMPVFQGEKNFNPHYFVIKMSSQYRFQPVNQCFCIVDYQPNGMSANIWKQYRNSPNSFAEYRRAVLQVPGMSFAYRYRTAAHYVASSILARNFNFLRQSPAKGLTLVAIPMGLLFAAVMCMKAGR
jgi:glycosyltransferase involved in cell wall biosynthesis